MKSVNATTARNNIYKLIDEANDSHEPIYITGKRGNAVLISESDWSAIQETMYLMGISGMKESIVEGLNTPIDKCVEKDDLDW